MKTNYFKRFWAVVLSLLLFGAAQVSAATWYYDTGNWNAVGSWSASPTGGAPRPTNFTTSGDVFIAQKNTSGSGSITFGAGVTLEVPENANVELSGPFVLNGAEFIVRSGATVTASSSRAITGSGTYIIEAGATVERMYPNSANITVTLDGTLTPYSNFSLGTLLGSGTLVQYDGSNCRTITLANTDPSVSTFLAAGGGTVVLGGGNVVAAALLPTYNNLKWTVSGSDRTFAQSTITVNGNLELERTGGSMTFNGSIFDVKGDVTLTGTILRGSALNLNLVGENQTITGSATQANTAGVMNLTVANGTTLKLLSDVSYPGTFANDGLLDCNGFELTVSGVPQACSVMCTPINTTFTVTSSQPDVCAGVASAAIGLDGSESDVSYKLFKNGGTTAEATVPGTGSAISFGTFAEGTYTVKGYGTGGNFCTTEVTVGGSGVTVGTNPALCTDPLIIVDPTSLDFGTIKAGTPKQLTFKVTGLNLSADIDISYPSGFSGVATADFDADEEIITVTFTATGDTTFSGDIELSSGTASATVAVTGTSDATAPTATAHTPTATTDVATSATITVTYDEDIQIADGSKILVNGSEANASVDGNVLTIEVPGGLQDCTTYNVEVQAGAVADVAGNVATPNATHESFSFRTIAGASGGFSAVQTYTFDNVTAGQAVATNGISFTAATASNNSYTGNCAGSTTGIRLDGSGIPSQVITFPQGVGTVTVYFASNGNRTFGIDGDLTSSSSGCNTRSKTYNTATATTMTIGATGTIVVWKIEYTLPDNPLSVNDEALLEQTINVGDDLEETVFTGMNVTPQLSTADQAALEALGFTVTPDNTAKTLTISGTATDAGEVDYTVFVNECTQIEGTITVEGVEIVQPLETYKIKWTDSDPIVQPTDNAGTYVRGLVHFTTVSTDNTDCNETYFTFFTDFDGYELYLDGNLLDIQPIQNWGPAAYYCYGELSGFTGLLQVVKPASGTPAPGKKNSIGDTVNGGKVVAEYDLVIDDVATGLNNPAADKQVKDCFNVLGVKVDCDNAQGVIIKRFSNGKAEKELKK